MAISERAHQMEYKEQVVTFAESERIKDARCWSSFCSFFSELLSAANCCSCHEQAKVDNSNDVLQTSPSVGASAPHKSLLTAASLNSSKPMMSSASKHSATLPTGRALGRTVTGTIFGYRKGKVTFCVQEDPKAVPTLLLELAMPTDILVREMASGLLRIALECETKGRNKIQEEMESEDGSAKLRKPIPLILEPVWSMFCNGRKVGFAIRRTCSESDRLVLSVIEQVSMGAGVIPVDEHHRPVVLSPDARSRSKQSSRRTSPERHRTEGHRWFPSVAKSARTSPERERRMGGPGSRDQSYRSSPDHRYLSRERPAYRSSPERAIGRERRSSLDMRRVSDDRDTTPGKTRSFDRSMEERAKVLQQHDRFEDRLKGAHERSKSGDYATFESISDKSPRRSPRRGIALFGVTDEAVETCSRQSTEFGTPQSHVKSETKSYSKSEYGTAESDTARRSLESDDEDVMDTATSNGDVTAIASKHGSEKGDALPNRTTQLISGNGPTPGSAHSVKSRDGLSNEFSDNGDVELSNSGSRLTRPHREDDYTPVSYHRIDEHMPLENGNGYLMRPSKLDVYNDLDGDHHFSHRPVSNGFYQEGHSHKPGQVATEELMYMRARYEHVVGSADAESFHMINPDGSPGQELSVFFLRI